MNHQAPDAEPGERRNDGSDPAQDGGYQSAHREWAEVEAALKKRQRDALERGKRHSEGEPAKHGCQIGPVKDVGDRSRAGQERAGKDEAQTETDPEHRVDVLSLNLGTLDERLPQSLIGEQVDECDHDHGEGDKPERVRRQQAREEDENDEVGDS